MEPITPPETMPAPEPAPPVYPVLYDTMPRPVAVPLDGWLERQRFHPLLTMLFVLVMSFMVFQGLAALVAVVLIVMEGGVPEVVTADLLTENPRALLIGNTVGQFVGMGFLVWFWTRLHTRAKAGFLRVRKTDWGLVGLGVLGLVVLMPVVQWLGGLNELIPLPEGLRALEEAQMALIEQILGGDTGFFFNLFVLALTPALCEELLFRGYVQRQLERLGGPITALVLTGLFFGLYHLRLSQVIPLSVLGIYMGYLVWRTGSLWPAVVVHFFNNAFAIVATRFVASTPELGLEAVESIEVPWYIVLPCIAGFWGVLRLMQHRAQTVQAAATPQHV